MYCDLVLRNDDLSAETPAVTLQDGAIVAARRISPGDVVTHIPCHGLLWDASGFVAIASAENACLMRCMTIDAEGLGKAWILSSALFEKESWCGHLVDLTENPSAANVEVHRSLRGAFCLRSLSEIAPGDSLRVLDAFRPSVLQGELNFSLRSARPPYFASLGAPSLLSGFHRCVC